MEEGITRLLSGEIECLAYEKGMRMRCRCLDFFTRAQCLAGHEPERIGFMTGSRSLSALSCEARSGSFRKDVMSHHFKVSSQAPRAPTSGRPWFSPDIYISVFMETGYATSLNTVRFLAGYLTIG